MDWASFILKHEAAISASGRDPRDDGVLAMMTDKMKEVQEQVRQLRAQMKEHEAVLSCTLEGRALDSAVLQQCHRAGPGEDKTAVTNMAKMKKTEVRQSPVAWKCSRHGGDGTSESQKLNLIC